MLPTLGQSRPGSDDNKKGTLHSPRLLHYLKLTIRLFSVISRTPIGGVLPLCIEAVGVFYCPSRLGNLLSLCNSILVSWGSYFVWWYINPCGLFNANSFFFVHMISFIGINATLISYKLVEIIFLNRFSRFGWPSATTFWHLKDTKGCVFVYHIGKRARHDHPVDQNRGHSDHSGGVSSWWKRWTAES